MHEVHYNRNAVYSIELCVHKLNESLKKAVRFDGRVEVDYVCSDTCRPQT